MFRTFAIATLTLLSLDATTTALAPATGLSLTNDAAAADFTGKIKRIRIRKKRVGSGFKITAKVKDDGDASTADAASLAIELCTSEGTCSDPIELGSDGFTGEFRSDRFPYAGAEVPEGEYKLATYLLTAEGKELGMAQSWALTAKGGEISVTPGEEVDAKPYVTELSLSTDECGYGVAEAQVAGDDASTVSTVEWVSLDGLLFAKDEVESCTDGPCVTGTAVAGKVAFTESEADLGKVGEALEASKSETISVIVTVYDSEGGELGTAKTEATAKYGDILIDGVPLEFD